MTRRLGLGYRGLFTLLSVLMLLLGGTVVASVIDGSFEPALLSTPLALLVLASSFLCFRVARLVVIATPVEVLVRNPLRSYGLSWTEVRDVRPTSSGLALRLRSGQVVTVWATARSGLRGAAIRYDHDALTYFQRQLDRSVP